MPKVKCTIGDVVPLKKLKQNPIIGKIVFFFPSHCIGRAKQSHSRRHVIYVAHFQNGTISDEFANEMDVFRATDTQQDGSASVLVAVSKSNVYDGYVGLDAAADLRRRFIAVRKKGADQVTLVEVNECSLLSYHYNNCALKKTQSTGEFSSMSTESARRILFKDFGGKKAMKVLERKEKMKVNVDVVKDQLDKTLLGKAMDAFSKGEKSRQRHEHAFSFVVRRYQSKRSREARRVRPNKGATGPAARRNGAENEQRSHPAGRRVSSCRSHRRRCAGSPGQ